MQLISENITDAIIVLDRRRLIRYANKAAATMAGHEVARRLREEFGAGTTLIALTGYGQEEDKQKALQAGFDHHLTKPASIRDINAIIETVVPETATQ